MSEESLDRSNAAPSAGEGELFDALTGVANRQAFEAALARAVGEQPETGGALCLLLADVDRFAAFNDTHGRRIGDHVLRLVAQELSQCVKAPEMLARYGEGQFAILLPETYASAIVLAESMRAIMEAQVVETEDGCSIERLTLSFGVAECRPEERGAAFVARAADCLEQSKAQGRNRVTGERDL